MQTLVIAHAAFGHNHFFKNNYLFKLWTDADGILDYLNFAKGYIASCEERYGPAAVERTLDAAHALMSHGVHPLSRQEEARPRPGGDARARSARAPGAHLQRSLAHGADRARQERVRAERRAAARAARAAAGQHPVLSREVRAPPAALAARAAAHRPPRRAVFLSAGADQGDERGHRDLRALSHHDAACTSGAPSATEISWSSCSRTPTWCSSPASTIRGSPASIPMRSASR